MHKYLQLLLLLFLLLFVVGVAVNVHDSIHCSAEEPFSMHCGMQYGGAVQWGTIQYIYSLQSCAKGLQQRKYNLVDSSIGY